MYCNKCGTQVPDDATFCSNCGARLSEPAQQTEYQPPQQPGHQQPPYQQGYQQDGYQSPYQQGYQPGGYQSPYQQGYQPGYQQPGYQPPYQPGGMGSSLPMNWFKFLIYFALWASGVLNLIMGILVLTGAQYELYETGGARLVYTFFPGLKACDVIYGIVLVAFAAFAIYTRFRLARFCKNGPFCLYLLYGVQVVISLLYAGIASIIIGQNAFSADTISSLVVSIVMIAVNYVYFKKRGHLFVN